MLNDQLLEHYSLNIEHCDELRANQPYKLLSPDIIDKNKNEDRRKAKKFKNKETCSKSQQV